MNNNTIAADYENVSVALKKMDQDISSIKGSINNLQLITENTNNWKGIDADAYREVLQRYAKKISNSVNWLQKLDSIISNHAEKLYERALEDQKTASFR